MELYKKYRPKTLAEVVGQKSAVAMLEKMIATKKIPHALMFVGPPGCGKTTTARIMKDHVGCGEFDFEEMDGATSRGIDTIRSIQERMNAAPMSGKSRVFLIDEMHRTTGDSQSAMLKILEDTPDHVYFMLATSEPKKILKAIVSRCTEIKVDPLSHADMGKLLVSVVGREKKKVSEEVIEKLIEVAEGSARKALVILGQVIDLDDESDQIKAILDNDVEKKGIDVARLLLRDNCSWGEVAKLLKTVDDEPETIRRIVLGYANAILLSGKASKKAVLVLQAFQGHFYDSGKAGLTLACYEVVHSR